MFCIDFEDESLVGQGADSPWVYNDGVVIVTDKDCPQGDRCGYFNGGGRLELPFFSNNYDGYKSLIITFYHKRTSASPTIQGLISNDCLDGLSGEPGNSLYASSSSTAVEKVEVGLKYPAVSLTGVSIHVGPLLQCHCGKRKISHTTHTHARTHVRTHAHARTRPHTHMSTHYAHIYMYVFCRVIVLFY